MPATLQELVGREQQNVSHRKDRKHGRGLRGKVFLHSNPRGESVAAPHHSQAFLNVVNDAKSRIKEEDYRETKKRIDAGEKIVLVDTREDSEWARGHIPGAIHLSKGIIERDIEKTVPDKNATVILYCGGGFRSALAADNLQKMGYTNVISMDGGWRGWTGSGFPVIKD